MGIDRKDNDDVWTDDDIMGSVLPDEGHGSGVSANTLRGNTPADLATNTYVTSRINTNTSAPIPKLIPKPTFTQGIYLGYVELTPDAPPGIDLDATTVWTRWVVNPSNNPVSDDTGFVPGLNNYIVENTTASSIDVILYIAIGDIDDYVIDGSLAISESSDVVTVNIGPNQVQSWPKIYDAANGIHPNKFRLKFEGSVNPSITSPITLETITYIPSNNSYHTSYKYHTDVLDGIDMYPVRSSDFRFEQMSSSVDASRAILCYKFTAPGIPGTVRRVMVNNPSIQKDIATVASIVQKPREVVTRIPVTSDILNYYPASGVWDKYNKKLYYTIPEWWRSFPNSYPETTYISIYRYDPSVGTHEYVRYIPIGTFSITSGHRKWQQIIELVDSGNKLVYQNKYNNTTTTHCRWIDVSIPYPASSTLITGQDTNMVNGGYVELNSGIVIGFGFVHDGTNFVLKFARLDPATMSQTSLTTTWVSFPPGANDGSSYISRYSAGTNGGPYYHATSIAKYGSNSFFVTFGTHTDANGPMYQDVFKIDYDPNTDGITCTWTPIPNNGTYTYSAYCTLLSRPNGIVKAYVTMDMRNTANNERGPLYDTVYVYRERDINKWVEVTETISGGVDNIRAPMRRKESDYLPPRVCLIDTGESDFSTYVFGGDFFIKGSDGAIAGASDVFLYKAYL